MIEFPDSSGGDVPACAELTKMLALACSALAESWGWPAVLVPTSSGFTNNLGRLRSLGLIDYPQPRQVVATPVLFLDGERQ